MNEAEPRDQGPDEEESFPTISSPNNTAESECLKRPLKQGEKLQPGDQIGHFRIKQELGRGGMGIVYLAYDTVLKRDVAIKGLPDYRFNQPDISSLWEHEARVLASLNHPNIATIHEVIEQENEHYLVLEYVQGETLAERLNQGPLEPQEALQIGHAVSAALCAAHAKGVVHRDLKPSNVKLTPEGQVKVLDFGLAILLNRADTSRPDVLESTGRASGTPGYMSPEQALGESLDHRSDIWSLGCVLYEMITGKRAFTLTSSGSSASSGKSVIWSSAVCASRMY